ncbi:MAG: outer membrane protein assembly factor BamA [Flavobacteriales bacterium]|nr:outer membrane protein assembly factor BamA [Flavobacteriales bacterium]
MAKKWRWISLILLVFAGANYSDVLAQDDGNGIILDYENPKEYVFGGLKIEGTTAMDPNVLSIITGLDYMKKIRIPGDEVTRAVENIWRQGIFSDVELHINGIKGDTVFLLARVVERPRLSKYSIKGLNKTETKNVRDEISLKRDMILTENLIKETYTEITKYFYGKGFFNADVRMIREKDTAYFNSEILRIHIKKGKRVKVFDYEISGNENLDDSKIRRLIKPKRTYHKINLFASSKLVESDFDDEKKKISDKYHAMGFRDAYLLYDSIVPVSANRVKIKLGISEGKKYYFRNIEWVGNTKYTSGFLDTVLNISRGDIFDQSKLDTRLYMNPNGFDVSSLYMDDGYLFFSLNPIEVRVDNDSIDLEIRIYEGKQATINKVSVIGNDKTSDKVILRTLRTKPGEKFSRTDIQRSLRELAALNYFDPEQLDVNPIPNPSDGTVDIEYKVVEKPSDQVEASGGFGGGFGFVGSVGLVLNNFSAKKLFEPGGWSPVPSGDGQRLTVRAQSNGIGYQAYNFSFAEPWLGGKKPNQLTISIYHSIQTNFRQKDDPSRATFKTTGASIGLGKLLDKPDDYFVWSNSINYQRYNLDKWTAFGAGAIGFTEGFSNSLSWNSSLTRNSTSAPVYPKNGSTFSLSLQFTPPYSAIQSLLGNERDYAGMSAQEKFKWIEYHKWKFNANWYTELAPKLVLAPSWQTGIIGLYSKELGYSPFEQFLVGGSGFGSWAFFGTEIIPLKGYQEGLISDPSGRREDADPIFNKFSVELRYPLSLNPSATVYGYTYFEAGNTWDRLRDFNPFELQRAAGFGVRMFLPMFGLLGFDYGWGFDKATPEKGHFLFSIGQQF